MRDISLVIIFVSILPMVFVYPFGGILCWTWLTLMNPHREVYGFAYGRPFNLVVAVLTLGAWLASRRRDGWPPGAMPWLILALLAWMTVNSFFAADPDWSWPLWEETVKVFVLVLAVLVSARTKARIHALVWVLVVSLAYYGVKGGVFTVLTGGTYRVYGPEKSVLGDNNHLALAIAMTLPLVNYLRLHTASPLLRLGLAFAFAIQILTVLGSYSRGGVIALACALGFFWLRSRRKWAYLLAGSILLPMALGLMPEAFFERMHSITAADHDTSFLGRVTSWQVCFSYAVDHFPFGAGFAGTQRTAVYNFYFPAEFPHAAHSIYFQILGEHGFPGLLLYLALMVMAFAECRTVVRQSRGRNGLRWAGELARMIQVSLVTFWIGGAALSMAYYDGYLILLVLPSALRALTALPRPAQSAVQREKGRKAALGTV